MKDRIQNRVDEGDKVMVSLPESQIIGFIAKIEEGGLITGTRSGGTEKRLGRVLVSAVIALPVDPETGMVAQLVKVYGADKEARDEFKEKVARAN